MLQIVTNLFQGVGDDPSKFTLCDLFRVFENAFAVLFQLGIVAAVVMFIWGGFKIMTAGGDPGKVTEGRNILRGAAVGVAIMLGAWLIIDTLLTILSGGSLNEIIGRIKC